LEADSASVRIRNFWRDRTFAWSDVRRVDVRPRFVAVGSLHGRFTNRLVCFTLSDGSTIGSFATRGIAPEEWDSLAVLGLDAGAEVVPDGP
jgi:hypothetical protein